jgi:hypothetical protein
VLSRFLLVDRYFAPHFNYDFPYLLMKQTVIWIIAFVVVFLNCVSVGTAQDLNNTTLSALQDLYDQTCLGVPGCTCFPGGRPELPICGTAAWATCNAQFELTVLVMFKYVVFRTAASLCLFFRILTFGVFSTLICSCGLKGRIPASLGNITSLTNLCVTGGVCRSFGII